MEEKVAALRKMHAENLHHYDARCPRCGRANAISRERLEMFTPGWEEAIKAPAAAPMTPGTPAMPPAAPSMPGTPMMPAAMPAKSTRSRQEGPRQEGGTRAAAAQTGCQEGRSQGQAGCQEVGTQGPQGQAAQGRKESRSEGCAQDQQSARPETLESQSRSRDDGSRLPAAVQVNARSAAGAAGREFDQPSAAILKWGPRDESSRRPV